MKKDYQDQDVIRLLERLKERESAYPTGLQEKRREAYLALGASALTLHVGLDHVAGEALSQAGHAANLPMTLGMKLTLGFLSTAIVGLSTYLGITVYENRDALRDFLQGGSPTAVWVSPSPSPSIIQNQVSTPTFLSTSTPIATPSPTGTILPSPTGTILPPEPGEAGPNATPTKPGWHYGQTKTPKPKP